MSSHTPGPWKVMPHGDIATADESALICETCVPRDGGARNQREANLRLIAAAPELLAALREAIRGLETDGEASAAASLRTTGRRAVMKAIGERITLDGDPENYWIKVQS